MAKNPIIGYQYHYNWRSKAPRRSSWESAFQDAVKDKQAEWTGYDEGRLKPGARIVEFVRIGGLWKMRDPFDS
jgi:hypothetical protein